MAGSMKDQINGIYQPPQAHARHSDPSTSHEAARGVTGKLSEKQKAVYGLFVVRREMTDLDICDYFKGPESTYRKRRTDLAGMGLVRDSGRKMMQRGSNRIIWEIVT